jgi:hypothetical protein
MAGFQAKNRKFVHCRTTEHLMLKNVTRQNPSGTNLRVRSVAMSFTFWWSKSREEPLTRTSSVAPLNQDQIHLCGG